jgi:hypothetical protein
MIKIDLSNAIPRRLGTYLLGIIPGLLFELSLALGDPHLGQVMIDRAKQIYPFQSYALLVLFVGSCLVIGQVFFLLSWFASVLIGSVYRFKRYLVRATFGSDWLYRAFGRLQGIPPKRNIFIRSLSRMVFWGRGKRFPFEVRPVLHCQRLAATQLLMRRYGITPSRGLSEPVDLEWQVWLSILGKQPPGLRETFLMMRTFLGCGLAGLSALYISPALRNSYFVAISVVFAASGCVQSWSFSKLKYDPMRQSLSRLASVLVELAETNTSIKNPEVGLDKRSSLTINTDAKNHD